MKVTFFGSTHGVPEPNRRFSCAMLEAGGKRYLIDIGFDPTCELINRGLNPGDITAVFITHRHSDHAQGLPDFAGICSWFFKTANPRFFLPNMDMLEPMRGWLMAVGTPLREDLRFDEVHEGLLYDDGTIRVTAMKTGHIECAYAYRIEAEGKKVLFTGDMKHLDGPTADFARYTDGTCFDLAVAECAHFDAMLYLEPLKKNPPKKFCLNHYSWAYVESCYHLKSIIEKEIPTVLATDGLVIEV